MRGQVKSGGKAVPSPLDGRTSAPAFLWMLVPGCLLGLLALTYVLHQILGDSEHAVLVAFSASCALLGAVMLYLRSGFAWRRLLTLMADHKLKTCLHKLPLPALLVKRGDGSVLFANDQGRCLTNRTVDGCLSLCDGDLQDPSSLLDFRDRNGAPRHALLSTCKTTYRGEDALVAVAIDVTENLAAKAQLDRQNRILRALADLQSHYLEAPDSGHLFEKWVSTALELTDSTGGSIRQIGRDDGGNPVLDSSREDDEGPVRTMLAVAGASDLCADDDFHIAIPLHSGSEMVGILELGGRRDGYDAILMDELALFFDSLGALIGSHRNGRMREEAENRLSKLSTAVEQSPTAVFITDREGQIEYVNPRFTLITGFSLEESIGRSPAMLKSGYMAGSIYREMWENLLAGRDWCGEIYNKRKDGELYWCRTHISPLTGRNGEVTHFVAVSEDISHKKRHEERLLHQANFDQLTDLPNRVLAFDRLCQVLNQAQRNNRPVTVMQVDIDKFKAINDALGHRAGDGVLVEAARRLQSCVRKTDTVARLGSDEFLVILAERTADDPPDLVARRILDAFRRPFEVEGNERFLSVSIGLTVAPDDGSLPQVLLQNCGVAMTRAKDQGNTYQFFTLEMNREAANRLEIDTHLRHALPRQELSLRYQPLLDIATGRMMGAEALLRWESTALGLVMPDRFIPLAEDTGVIVPIGDWVLAAACRQAKNWLDRGIDMTIAVNTSSRQLRRPQIVTEIEQALESSGLPPNKLELEVTETFLIEDARMTGNVLAEISRLGVRLSLDDFGTGYSSLAYLKRYPFDTLKIDRSFIHDVLDNASDRALVKAIIAMAHSLNLRVVGEGVETMGQLDLLKELGCDAAQGYYYSHPLTAEAFDAFAQSGENLGAGGHPASSFWMRKSA